MKKLILSAGLFILSVSSFAEKAIIKGKVSNCEKVTNSFIMDYVNPMAERIPFTVNEDGTYYIELDINGPKTAYWISEDPKTGFKFYIEPGKTITVDLNLEKTTMNGMDVIKANEKFGGDLTTECEFFNKHSYYDAQNAALTALQANPKMTFGEFRGILRYEVDKLEGIFMKIGTKDFRQFMLQDYENKYKGSLSWYMELGTPNDSAFVAMMEALDLNDADQASTYASYYKKSKTPAGQDRNLFLLNHICEIIPNKEFCQNIATETFISAMAQAPENISDLYEVYKNVMGDKGVSAEVQAMYDLKKTMVPGAKAVDFDFYDQNGKKFTLSKLKGKAVYLDCWATWCGPCCAEIPNMEKLANHYKNSKDVQIISISLDKKESAWKAKLAKDKPSWPQFIVKGEFDCKLCKTYEINGIPRFMMFDKKGNIISIDAPRPSLPNIIEWIDSKVK